MNNTNTFYNCSVKHLLHTHHFNEALYFFPFVQDWVRINEKQFKMQAAHVEVGHLEKQQYEYSSDGIVKWLTLMTISFFISDGAVYLISI